MHSIKGVRSLTSSHCYLADANSRPMPNAVLDQAYLVLESNDTTPGRVPANDDGGPSFALRIVLSSEKHASAHYHPPVCRPFRKHFQHQIGCLFARRESQSTFTRHRHQFMQKCYPAAHFVSQSSPVYVAVLQHDLHLYVAQPSIPKSVGQRKLSTAQLPPHVLSFNDGLNGLLLPVTDIVSSALLSFAVHTILILCYYTCIS